jgi:glutathione S-transferase
MPLSACGIITTHARFEHAGARVRYIMHALSLHDKIDIKSPGELGGLKGKRYLALSPVGKMPVLVLPSGQAIPESTVRTATMCCLHRCASSETRALAC